MLMIIINVNIIADTDGVMSALTKNQLSCQHQNKVCNQCINVAHTQTISVSCKTTQQTQRNMPIKHWPKDLEYSLRL